MTHIEERTPVYYHDYLQLDRLLSAQVPLSGGEAPPAHDEMLFIIVHQAYELWFKQILHELEAVHTIFEQPVVEDVQMGRIAGHLERVVAIQGLLIDQIDVLETMTALDFLDFRDVLVPASGFQSVQFRLIENLLGLRRSDRMLINEAPYTSRFAEFHRDRLEASEARPSLFDLVEAWLARTPFLQFGDYDFWEEYRAAVGRMLDRERRLIEENPNLVEEGRAKELARTADLEATFAAMLEPDAYAELRRRGVRRMSQEAFLAALLINLYRDEPMLQLPFRVLRSLGDVDEGFTLWRSRHALMVRRMIGAKIGTGGTSGHHYLAEAANRHRIWTDLADVSTFLIPRSRLPELPTSVTQAMGFARSGGGGIPSDGGA
jgi:tryptophan 2,3-dioxygenase